MGDFYTIIYGYGVYAVYGKERLEVEEERREGGVSFTYPKQVGCVVLEDGGRIGGALSLGF